MSVNRVTGCALVLALALVWPSAAPAGLSLEDSLFLAADAYYRGDFVRAEAAFGDALELDPGNAYALSRQGAAAVARAAKLHGAPGEKALLDTAKQRLSAVLAARPDHVFARTWLGVACELAGEPDRAKAEYEKVLAAAPDYPPGLLFDALALLTAGDKTGALARLTRLAGRDHADAEVHAACARLLTGLGLHAAANLEWERALALSPNDSGWLVALGGLLERRGNHAMTVSAYEQVLAMTKAAASPVLAAPPETGAGVLLATALETLAWKAADAGRPAEAVGLCRAALRADPAQAGCLYLARAGGVAAPPRATTPQAALEPARAIQPAQTAQLIQSGQPAQAQSTPTAKRKAEPGGPEAAKAVLPDGQAGPAVGRDGPAHTAQAGEKSPAVDRDGQARADNQAPGANRARVGISRAKLRSAPDGGAAVVEVLRPGQRLVVIARDGDWTEATAPSGARGFVNSKLLIVPESGQDRR